MKGLMNNISKKEMTTTPNVQGHSLSYVLITPARNEEAFIEQTIQSVINQTILPLRWVIVSDGSTDRTDEIVSKYTADHPWIELVRMPESGRNGTSLARSMPLMRGMTG